MTRDGHVRLLPLHVANKIAAGEVVERPASVLKELLENSIDAGATRIEVAVTAGGRKLVSVRDNGCGMSREDAMMSLERQATSKIRDVDDIERIDTLGFRGEAIPSIAAVSRFTLVTRPESEEEATRLVVNAGTLAEVASCGAPPGTRVEVRDLFCNVPARRKFLRAYATEEAHIKNVFAVNALAHPAVAMSLSVDGREIWRFAAGATLEDRIRELYGQDFSESLLRVSLEGQTSVRGYIERPGRQESFRREQHIFVNGRPASSPVISYALRDAYPSRPGDARPTAILFIDLPPDQVDVNVHPAKREVRFRRPADVRDAVFTAITSAFASPASGSAAQTAPPQPQPETPVTTTSSTPCFPEPSPVPFQIPIQPTLPPHETPPPCGGEAPAQESGSEQSDGTPQMETAAGPWRWFEFLAQTSEGYLLLETDAGLVTIHPQAALERIVYERLLDGGTAASQPLLIPETVQLTPLESVKIESFKDVLATQGFQIESFGGGVWKIDAVPQALGTSSARDALAAIAHDIAEAGAKRGGTRWREELVAKSAARTAAGGVPRCTPESARRLVEQLASCRMPYICPRGKPVMVFTSNRELARKFDRSCRQGS
jgi:DNA mismatch repair protein MutL